MNTRVLYLVLSATIATSQPFAGQGAQDRQLTVELTAKGPLCVGVLKEKTAHASNRRKIRWRVQNNCPAAQRVTILADAFARKVSGGGAKCVGGPRRERPVGDDETGDDRGLTKTIPARGQATITGHIARPADAPAGQSYCYDIQLQAAGDTGTPGRIDPELILDD